MDQTGNLMASTYPFIAKILEDTTKIALLRKVTTGRATQQMEYGIRPCSVLSLFGPPAKGAGDVDRVQNRGRSPTDM